MGLFGYLGGFKIVSNEELKQRLREKKEGKAINGYLICDTCHGSHQLKPGEKPEDFSSKCECGGQLKYINNLDNKTDWEDFPINTVCPFCGRENSEGSKYCASCGKEINPQTNIKNETTEKPSNILIVFGYFFAIVGIFGGVGSIIGLIIGIILYRRNGPDRIHGIIITGLSVVILFLAFSIAALIIYRAYFST